MSTFNFTNNEERTNNNTTTKLICDFGGEHGDKVGFKNENGELVIPYKYDDAMQYEVKNEPIVVKLNNKWRLIDENGNEVCEPMFDEIKIWHSEMDGYFYEAYLGNKTYSLSKTGVFVEK